MARRPCLFKETDVSRLYKAAVAAGMRDPHIEVDLERKKITARSGAQEQSSDDLDRELGVFEARHGQG
jgi:hypothetical protein